MIPLSPRLLAVGAVGVALALSHAWAYRTGYRASDDAHAVATAKAQQEAMRAAELASLKEAERLALEAERDALALELEDAANADPDAGRVALPASSVLRIDRR